MKFISKQLNKARYATLAILISLALQSPNTVFGMQSTATRIMGCTSIIINGYEELANFLALEIPYHQLQELSIHDCANLKPHILVRIFQLLPYLTKLNIANNNLTTLPPEIAYLINLQKIDLSGNPKVFINIYQLSSNLMSSNLTTLKLSKNHLEDVPELIFGMRINLQKLDLSFNEFTRIPPWIGVLTKLEVLNLSCNNLTDIPSEISNLSNLKTLFLNTNQLTTIPAKIGLLTNLKELKLSYNNLTHLPSELGKLTKLKNITLEHNISLTELPAEIVNLIELQNILIYTYCLSPKAKKLLDELRKRTINLLMIH